MTLMRCEQRIEHMDNLSIQLLALGKLSEANTAELHARLAAAYSEVRTLV